VKPLFTFIGLSAFVIYVTWAAFQGKIIIRLLYLAALFTRTYLATHHIAGLVKSRLVAHLVTLVTGAIDIMGTGLIPSHLLLLPRRILQSFLG
jgi:hypothetical protein